MVQISQDSVTCLGTKMAHRDSSTLLGLILDPRKNFQFIN